MQKNFVINTLCLFALISFGVALSLVLNVTNDNNKKQFTLPPLPYAYNALEPYIDAQTMELHHSKHHQSYVDNLNATLKDYPDLLSKSIEELLINLESLPEKIRDGVRNFGGGHYNHSLFWIIMMPPLSKGFEGPHDPLHQEIEKKWHSFDKFKEKFNESAKKLFGSGWVWLCINKDGKLKLVQTKDQDSPLTDGLIPILGLDVWEHAYYLKYQNKRIDYISAWWNVVNWDEVEKNYQEAIKKIAKKQTKEK